MDENLEWEMALAAADEGDKIQPQKMEPMKKHVSVKSKPSNSFQQQPVSYSGGNDEGWGDEEEGSDGWGNVDYDGDSQMISEEPSQAKTENQNEQIRIFNQNEIVTQMPKKVQKANELLNMSNDDDVIAILRHFSWN